MGKTLKLKGFVMNQTQNLFGMDWIESFDFLNQLINSFCSSVSVNSNSVDKIRKELKINFLKFFLRVWGGTQKFKQHSKSKRM